MTTVFLPAWSTPEALASVNVHCAVAGNQNLLHASQNRTNSEAVSIALSANRHKSPDITRRLQPAAILDQRSGAVHEHRWPAACFHLCYARIHPLAELDSPFSTDGNRFSMPME
ncbi:MAG TPA: hypothetical protein PLB67_18780 [Candidatus Hydrogenedentes bacterium]|jgi:hypothetical protein|nr:hypothetical protein [Candidatus Hydrogenedentota bacterium]